MCTDYCGANDERKAARYMVTECYGGAPEYLRQECMEEADRMQEPRGLEFFTPRGAAELHDDRIEFMARALAANPA